MEMTATLIFLIFLGFKNAQNEVTHLNQPGAKAVEFQSMELYRDAEDTYDRLNTAAAKRNEDPGKSIMEVCTKCLEIR